MKRFLIIFLFIFNIKSIQFGQNYLLQDFSKPYKFFSGVIKDFNEFHSFLFSRDSLYILGTGSFIYFGSSLIDDTFHFYFYDNINHRNKYSILGKYIPDISLASLICFITFLGFSEIDIQTKLVSKITLLGLPLVGSAAKILKLLKWKGSLRPKCEFFSRELDCYGGFPSGHLSIISYLSTIFTLYRYYPITIACYALSVYVFLDYLIINRHYFSQLIGGIILGVTYGIAASKLIKKNLYNMENLEINLINRNLGVQVSYQF